MYVNILVILNANELSLMLFFSIFTLRHQEEAKKVKPITFTSRKSFFFGESGFLTQGSFLFIFFWGKNTQTRCRDFGTRPRRSISLGYSLFKFNWQSSKGSKLWSQVIFLFIIAVSLFPWFLFHFYGNIWLNGFNFPAKRLRKKTGAQTTFPRLLFFLSIGCSKYSNFPAKRLRKIRMRRFFFF